MSDQSEEGAVELADYGGWPETLGSLCAHRDLDRAHAAAVMRNILGGKATPAQIGGFIVAMRMKGETVEELDGLLDAAFEASTPVPLDLDREPVIDVVGTGGDGSHSINVSTLAALVVAGAGGRVCKHGNRSASSKAGSADLLERLGVTIDVPPEVVVRCVEGAGIGFCLAPSFHPAWRHAGPPRRELGVPTLFNYLGPIANPARVRRYVVGVGDSAMARPVAEVLASRGAERAYVVYGHDGMDELTTATTSTVLELRDGQLHTWTLDPSSYGLAAADRGSLAVTSPEHAAEAAEAVLGGAPGPHRDIVVLNAGAGLVIAGLVEDIGAGLALAAEAIDQGRAADALSRLVALSAGGRSAG